MVHSLTAHQQHELQTTERVAACLSLIGTSFIVFSFLYSPAFRKPVNRLIFFASWGNIAYSIAALMSQAPMRAGPDSHFCHFQAFLIQMFHPADALWNLAMAINVYLAIFRKYTPQQLRRLEWKYHIMCYGVPFPIAFIYIFINTKAKHSIYGPAILWCWIRVEWSPLRIALVYAPAWCCIVLASTIYFITGREIYAKRRHLRGFLHPSSSRPEEIISLEDPFTDFKTTEIRVTSELTTVYSPATGDASDYFTSPTQPPQVQRPSSSATNKISGKKVFSPYSVSVGQTDSNNNNNNTLAGSKGTLQQRKNRAALEANAAAWGYTKVALLFFVSMLVTWVPSSINRVYALIHPTALYFPFIYVSGLCLPLMGFWNAVIYITASWGAVRLLFLGRLPRNSNGYNISGGGQRSMSMMTRPPLSSMKGSCGDGRQQQGGETESLENIVGGKEAEGGEVGKTHSWV